MSNLGDIHIVNLTGPGSQPEDEEGQLEYIAMPKEMDTFQQPILPEPEDTGDITQALTLLDAVRRMLINYNAKPQANLFDLQPLNEASQTLINQLLGVGEVSITIDGTTPVHIQESVMAGLWRVRYMDSIGRVVGDFIEVADVPACVRQLSFEAANHSIDTVDKVTDCNVINAPSVLTELAQACAQFKQGDPARVINLTLLPLSDADLALIGEKAGVGPVTILSRGYGNCRIGSTKSNNLWWIKYYNSEDALILNTLEVIDVPDVALAAPEDIADSAHRLAEMMEIYQ